MRGGLPLTDELDRPQNLHNQILSMTGIPLCVAVVAVVSSLFSLLFLALPYEISVASRLEVISRLYNFLGVQIPVSSLHFYSLHGFHANSIATW